MDTESKIKVSYATEYIVIIGYAVFFCGLIFACLGYFFINRSQYFPEPTPVPVNPFAETLPSTIPTPHISSRDQFQTTSNLFLEDFDNNQNQWLDSEDDTKERIHDGKLYFQSRNDGEYSIISCKSCPSLEAPYYFETNLSTNIATDEEYGVVFNRSYTLGNFYLFLINPESRKYFLFHRTSEEWTLRASGENTIIRPYPESNTLGVYTARDFVELYINNVIVEKYTESDTSFYPGFFGIYTNNSWFGVYADNVAIYEIGE
jgi:hypothetical protein